MLKKFLNGLVFGAGFGIALVAVIAVTLYFALPYRIETQHQTTIDTEPKESQESEFTLPESNLRGPDVISSVLAPSVGFLGVTAKFGGNFNHNFLRNNTALAGGPGKIIGKATADGKGVGNLKLRLALNGRVMSQWTTTDTDGRYEVRVPYGKYRVDGFELDPKSVNAALPGKIHHPQCASSSGTFDVGEGQSGRGLDLKFTNPVIKKYIGKKFSLSDEVVVAWEAYPGASQYSVQIYEKPDPNEFNSGTGLFLWRSRPKVSKPFFNVKKHKVKLKPNHYYILEIQALDNKKRTISETARTYRGFDFEVVE